MNLNKQHLLNFFEEKNIHYVYHANTVATSITFIEHGGLLSRGYVEKNGLFQTTQTSDPIDKKFDVFEDIFLDTTDLHSYFGRQNHYGPILYKFSTAFLTTIQYEVWITKNNPIYWNLTMSDNDKYFESVDELSANWDKYGRQRKMITIRKPQQPLLFSDLDRIIVDDPRVQLTGTGQVYFNDAVIALKKAYRGNEYLRNKFQTRECTSCFCRDNYLHQLSISKLNSLFLPKEGQL